MNVAGKKGIRRRETPKWESELWSYLSKGDGSICPMYSYCQNKLSGGWCPSDNLDYIARLLDDKRFAASKYEPVGKRGKCEGVFLLVERLARNYLKRAEVHCPPVSEELVYLADQHHPIEVRLVPLKIYHGAIWHLNDSWIIQLNENDTPARRRFALFHEAFHILAHRRTTTLVFKKRGYTIGSFNELLADYFAACILLPREWVREKWPEVRDLDQIAKIFDVPKQLMWIRLREMDLI